MKKLNGIALAAIIALTAACGGKNTETEERTNGQIAAIEGDSTIYGLACDGCSDTIVVFLRSPYQGQDPDTLNILEATKQHRVFGRPLIGDEIAIVRNSADTTVADMMVVTQDLKGEWCYRVLPALRERAGMDGAVKAEQPDSVKELLSVEREYGVQLKAEGAAFPIGLTYRAATTDEEEIVVYPELKRYFEWHLFNGHLVLQAAFTDSLGERHVTVSDTADVEMLGPDTLVLRFKDYVQGYYRRQTDDEE